MRKILLITIAFLATLNAQEVYATFNIEADKSANLAFYSSGIVESVFVDVSSEVKKGQSLAKLQNDDLVASLNIAKAKVQEAEVTLKFSKRDYERQLLIKNLIDEAKFDQYTLAYERAKVALSSAKANLHYQKALLDRSEVFAPFDGVIVEKSVEVGDVVSGMMLRTIFKVQSKSKRKLIFEFDQKYWKSVKVGDSVKYSVNGDGNNYTGKISKVYPIASSENRKIKAEVEANDFVVGLFGEGYISVAK